MKIKQFEIRIANLNPQIGTETGKIWPVLVIQTNLPNKIPHPSTIICPITSNIKKGVKILWVNLKKNSVNLTDDYDVMIVQIRTIENKRLLRKMGDLPPEMTTIVKRKYQDNIEHRIESAYF